MLITKVGYFAPFVIIGSVMNTIGCGLIYTWSTTTGPAQWVSYQLLVGFGVGFCFQTPMMAAQALSLPEDISSTTAILLCKSATLLT